MTNTLLRPAPRVLTGAAAAAAALALVPVGYLLIRTGEAGPQQFLAVTLRPRTMLTLATSVGLMFAVVLACLAIGVPLAWFLARSSLPGRAVWLVLVALPLAVPSYVAAYAWLSVVPSMQGFWAAALVLTLVSLPYVVIPTVAAIARVDPAPEEVARSLGRGPFGAFVASTLPQAWPATAAGSLLVALYVLSDFGAVAIFRVDAFTRVIYATYRASFDRTSAAVLACLLVGLAVLLVAAEQWVRTRTSSRRISESARATRSAGGAVRNAVPVELGPIARVTGWVLLSGVVLLALLVPLTSLLLRAFEGSRRPLDWTELLRATGASISVSALGAAIALLLALPVASLAARYRNRMSRLIEQAAFAGHALPGVVVGLSLVFLTVALLPGIYQTSFTLGFAYAVLFLPKAIGSTRTAIAAVPESLEDVARSLGRSGTAAWWTVTARLSWTGALAGALLVMLTAMKELPATLMLRPTGMDTLATELWSRTEVAAYGAAAPYALALVVIAAIPAWLVARAVTSTDAVTL